MRSKLLFIEIMLRFAWYIIKRRSFNKAIVELNDWSDRLMSKMNTELDVLKKKSEEATKDLREAKTEQMIVQAELADSQKELAQIEKEQKKIQLKLDFLNAAQALIDAEKEDEEKEDEEKEDEEENA